MSTYQLQLLHQCIRAEVTQLDEGYDIGLYGGCKTHVGAVTLAEPDGTCSTILRETHRDDVISVHFAQTLSKHWHTPVCMRCGIHFDQASQSDIAAILEACNALLDLILVGNP